MPKFAANLSMMFTEVPFLERFGEAARAGFAGVEFLFPYDHSKEEVAQALKSNGLQNVLFNMPPGDWAKGERGMAALPGREEEFRAGVAKAIDYALALGTPRLHVMAGLRPAGVSDADLHSTYVANLRYACAEAAKHGLEVLIEPINTRDIPGYYLNTQAQGHAVREEVGAPNLKVQMDFYHVQIVEGDIAMRYKQWQAHVGHIQIASVPARNEPDVGEVNYPWLFQMLDASGYQGWIGCEYRPAKGTREGLGWFAQYRK